MVRKSNMMLFDNSLIAQVMIKNADENHMYFGHILVKQTGLEEMSPT